MTGPLVKFMQDRFAKVGRSTQGASRADLYKAILNGNPGTSANVQDGFGSSVNSQLQKSSTVTNSFLQGKYFGGADVEGFDSAGAYAARYQEEQRIKELTADQLATAKEGLLVAESSLAVAQARTRCRSWSWSRTRSCGCCWATLTPRLANSKARRNSSDQQGR